MTEYTETAAVFSTIAEWPKMQANYAEIGYAWSDGVDLSPTGLAPATHKGSFTPVTKDGAAWLGGEVPAQWRGVPGKWISTQALMDPYINVPWEEALAAEGLKVIQDDIP